MPECAESQTWVTQRTGAHGTAKRQLQIFQGLIFAVAVKVSFQAPEGNTDHVAVVQTRAESVTEPQPQLVQTVQVLGPKGPRFTYTEGRPGLMTSSEKE